MRRSHRTRAIDEGQESSSHADAASAVNEGLRLFEAREYEAATRAFTSALHESERGRARAASYNRACGYIKLNKYEEAKDDLIAGEYVQLEVQGADERPRLDTFRASAEYSEVAAAVKGGQDASAMVNLRAEAQEPFRFIKLYLFGGLARALGWACSSSALGWSRPCREAKGLGFHGDGDQLRN